MLLSGAAHFVPDPRRVEELSVPHLLSDEKAYEVVKVITLSGIVYGNFITDMLADRQYIEDNHSLCEKAPYGNAF